MFVIQMSCLLFYFLLALLTDRELATLPYKNMVPSAHPPVSTG